MIEAVPLSVGFPCVEVPLEVKAGHNSDAFL